MNVNQLKATPSGEIRNYFAVILWTYTIALLKLRKLSRKGEPRFKPGVPGLEAQTIYLFYPCRSMNLQISDLVSYSIFEGIGCNHLSSPNNVICGQLLKSCALQIRSCKLKKLKPRPASTLSLSFWRKLRLRQTWRAVSILIRWFFSSISIWSFLFSSIWNEIHSNKLHFH